MRAHGVPAGDGGPRAAAAGVGLALALACGCRAAPPASAGADALDASSAEEIGDLAALAAEGHAHFRAQRPEEARDAFLALAERAGREGVPDARVEGLCMAARMETLLDRVPEARALLEQAGSIARPERPDGWSRYLLVRGVVEREEGRLEDARATFGEAYEYALDRGLEARAIDAAHFAAMLGDPDDQLAWAFRGIRAAEAAHDERWLAVLWNNLGWTYDAQGRREEALSALEQARLFHHKTGDARARLIADWSVGHALRELGRHEEARALLEDALARAARRYRDDPTRDAAEWYGLAEKELGELELEEGDVERGLARLERARERLVEAEMGSWAPADLAELERRIEALRAGDGGAEGP